MSSRSRYTRLAVSLSGMLLAAAACGGGAGYDLTGATAASAATHTNATTTHTTMHTEKVAAHTNTAAGSHCDHGADARR
jgi:ABC-type glycerol-3-phosphate transport system substrate-binding protein